MIGIGRVARAKPDGYTLAFSVSFSTHVVHGAIYALPYDVISDFEPVALVTEQSAGDLAKKAMPANDLKGLIAWLKANPDKASLGQTGPGSPDHVAGVLFQKQTGTRFQFVPYRGAGQRCRTDRRTYRPDVRLPRHCPAARACGHHQGLCGHRQEPLGSGPEIPTVDEAGLPGILRLDLACNLGAQGHAAGGDRQAQCRRRGFVGRSDRAHSGSPISGWRSSRATSRRRRRSRAFQKAEIEKWWPIIKAAGIKVE